ncbi:MAG: rod shape-determining protein MreC [Leptospiraceae bacterium]|nr:rod shape-determining protein MreC [Leptospiraceae bacterium]
MLADILSRNKNAISLGFCISFSILCILWRTNPFAQGLSFFGKMADRVSNVLDSGLNFTGDFIADIDDYRELKLKYEQLQKQLEAARLESDKFEQLQHQNEIYRDALGFTESKEYKEVKAEVMGVRLNAISPRIIIGQGSKSGIQPLMPVIARSHDSGNNLIRSVVGLVVAVNETTAIVQPLLHPSFRLGVRLVDTGEWAILSGNSDRYGLARLTYLTSDFEADKATFANRSTELQKNHMVVTSGAGGLFPKGIPVGFVTEAGKRENEFRTAYVQPFAPISSLDYLSVILKRPDTWYEIQNQHIKLEDNLITEFGEPVYPDLPIRTEKANPVKKPATGESTGPQNNNTATTEKNPREVQDNRTSEEPTRRTLQNSPGATP